jgi:CheY-like chemotaxis protein
LDLSKIEAGECEIEKQDVAIQEVLSDVTTVMSLRAMDKGLKLTVSASGAIPTRIRTDLLRLRQVLINIVGNAIKFTSKGSIEVTIQQVPGDNGVKLAFVVSDTGLGISPEHAAKLFAPFVQADSSTKRKFGGTGLGLALSKRLAGLLGGDVALTKSALGRGSTFTITIDPGPIRDLLFESADGAWSDIPTIPFASVGRDRLKDRRVLVVDDSIDNRVLVTRYLQLEGAIVESAKNGKEAVEMVHKKPYDVLLMDLQMPVMDGFEATAALRREGYKCPVIALTAHALKEERERCLSNGFDAHLPKPIDRLALVEALAQRCGTNQA